MRYLPKILITGSALIITACATGPTPYAPAQSDGLGYSDQFIEDDRVRVSFTARSDDEARDLAMLRAAEIAESRGYPYFLILGHNKEGFDEGQRSGVSPRVGIGVGSGGYRGTNVGVGINLGLGGNSKTRIRHILMIRLLSEDQENAYETDEVLRNLRASYVSQTD